MTNAEIFEDELHIDAEGKACDVIVQEIENAIKLTDFGPLEDTQIAPARQTTARQATTTIANRKDKEIEWTTRVPDHATGFLIGSKQTNKLRLEKKHQASASSSPTLLATTPAHHPTACKIHPSGKIKFT